MSRLQALKVRIQQRLAAAVEEIFGLVDQTIAECEEEMSRRRHRLLDVAVKPETHTGQETGFHADVQRLLVSQADVSDPPQPPHIKEEQEELWTSQEGEQLQGLEEADGPELTFTPDPVKREDVGDEEEAQTSHLHQSQTEENREGEDLKPETEGEGCRRPEPDRNSGMLYGSEYSPGTYPSLHSFGLKCDFQNLCRQDR
ncbi:hypothetical protein INR49_009380 [Caranx melampygus]|nr:hypothetical protein INR49_009380 [Caranx melampygus]